MRLLVCLMGFAAVAGAAVGLGSGCTLPAVRPPAAQRRYVVPEVDANVTAMAAKLRDANLATLYSNTLPNALDTTVYPLADGTFLVITGDITAMWLRDSTRQLQAYLPFVPHSAAARDLVVGTLHRQAEFVLSDPYANAFHFPNISFGVSPHADDSTSFLTYFGARSDGMALPLTFERKFGACGCGRVGGCVGGWALDVVVATAPSLTGLSPFQRLTRWRTF